MGKREEGWCLTTGEGKGSFENSVSSVGVSEEAAEVGGEEAGGIEGGLVEEGFLDGGHAEGEGVVLLAEFGGVAGEVVDTVLLAQGSQAQHQDPGHQEQLHEAVLALHRVLHEPQRPPSRPSPEAAPAMRLR